MLEEMLPPFNPGLKWCFHTLHEEILLSSLGHCLPSDLMRLKISTQLNTIMWLSKLFLTVQANFFSIYESGLCYIMHILSHGVTI